MVVLFALLYSISKILICINSYMICCFNTISRKNIKVAKIKLARFLYSSLLISFAQNAIIGIFCFLFAESEKAAFEIFIVFSFALQLIFLLVIMLLKKKTKVKHFHVVAKIFPLHKYISLLLSFFAVNISAVWIFENSLSENTSTLQTALVIIVILTVIIISVILSDSFAKYTFLHRSSSLKKQYKMQLEHYREIESLNNELKSFRHDFLNHIHCIHALVDSGYLSQAKEYIEKLENFKSINQNIFHTGNPICDAVLTSKQSYAKSVGVSIKANCHISKNIESIDLCTLLSNALDNSIEACVKYDGRKEIKMSAYVQHGFQYIKITNPSSVSDLSFETTKTDKSLHGIGVANIKKIVKKYDGTFSAKQDEVLFTLKIILKIDKILPPPRRNFRY